MARTPDYTVYKIWYYDNGYIIFYYIIRIIYEYALRRAGAQKFPAVRTEIRLSSMRVLDGNLKPYTGRAVLGYFDRYLPVFFFGRKKRKYDCVTRPSNHSDSARNIVFEKTRRPFYLDFLRFPDG